jgi:hypothetical protein
MIQSLPVDVVRLVVDAIDSPASLAALAGTSKAFSEPALDKLWYRIDNVYVLAKCMPRRLWSEYEGRGRCTCESYRKVVRTRRERSVRIGIERPTLNFLLAVLGDAEGGERPPQTGR